MNAESCDQARKAGGQQDKPAPDPDQDMCFFFAGSLLGFSISDRCPDGDREWIKDAGDQFKLLAFAHFHPGSKG